MGHRNLSWCEHDTTERIFGTSTGCYVVQSIRRVPEDRRYDSQLLANVRGLPWKPVPEGPEDQGVMELPEPVNLEPECPDVPALPTDTADAGQTVRRYYITARDLEKYGYTDGCPACDAIRAKMPRAGISHALGCRERIEKAVSSDPNRNSRFLRNEEKITTAVAQTVEQHDKRRIAEGSEEPEARRQRTVQQTAASGSGLTPAQRTASLEADQDRKRQSESDASGSTTRSRTPNAMDTDRDPGTVLGPGEEGRGGSQDVSMHTMNPIFSTSWKECETTMSVLLKQHREDYIMSQVEDRHRFGNPV